MEIEYQTSSLIVHVCSRHITSQRSKTEGIPGLGNWLRWLLAAGELNSFVEPTVKAFERPVLVQFVAQTEMIGNHCSMTHSMIGLIGDARFSTFDLAQPLAVKKRKKPLLFPLCLVLFPFAACATCAQHAQHAASVPVSERNRTRARLTALTCVQPQPIRPDRRWFSDVSKMFQK